MDIKVIYFRFEKKGSKNSGRKGIGKNTILLYYNEKPLRHKKGFTLNLILG